MKYLTKVVHSFWRMTLPYAFFLQCTGTSIDSFSSESITYEKKIREELTTVVLIRCIETGGDNTKLLESFIFVDKLFSKSSGSRSQRDRITYKKEDAENCRNNLLLFQIEKCDFKPFDFWNYILDKQLCNLEPVSFFQF